MGSMDYTTLGKTGLEVSRICLGCMSYGDPGWRDWVLAEDEARPFFERAEAFHSRALRILHAPRVRGAFSRNRRKPGPALR